MEHLRPKYIALLALRLKVKSLRLEVQKPSCVTNQPCPSISASAFRCALKIKLKNYKT